jgi:hypothetical protein
MWYSVAYNLGVSALYFGAIAKVIYVNIYIISFLRDLTIRILASQNPYKKASIKTIPVLSEIKAVANFFICTQFCILYML